MTIQIKKSNRSMSPVQTPAQRDTMNRSAGKASLEGIGNTTDLLVTGIETKAGLEQARAERTLEYDNASALDAQNTANTLYNQKRAGLRNQVDTGEINANEYLSRSDELFTESKNEARDMLQNAQQQNIYGVYSEAQKDKFSPEEIEYQATAITNFNQKASADQLESTYAFAVSNDSDEALSRNYQIGLESTVIAKPDMSPEEAAEHFAAGYANNVTTSLSAEGRVNPMGAMGKATYNLGKGWISEEQYAEIYNTTMPSSRFSETNNAATIALRRFGSDRENAYALIEQSQPSPFFAGESEYTNGLIQDKKDRYDELLYTETTSGRLKSNSKYGTATGSIHLAIATQSLGDYNKAYSELQSMKENGDYEMFNSGLKALQKGFSSNPKTKEEMSKEASSMFKLLAGSPEAGVSDFKDYFIKYGEFLDKDTMEFANKHAMGVKHVPQDQKDAIRRAFVGMNENVANTDVRFEYTSNYKLFESKVLEKYQALQDGDAKNIDYNGVAMSVFGGESKKYTLDEEYETLFEQSNSKDIGEDLGLSKTSVDELQDYFNILSDQDQYNVNDILMSSLTPAQKESAIQEYVSRGKDIELSQRISSIDGGIMESIGTGLSDAGEYVADQVSNAWDYGAGAVAKGARTILSTPPIEGLIDVASRAADDYNEFWDTRAAKRKADIMASLTPQQRASLERGMAEVAQRELELEQEKAEQQNRTIISGDIK